ncbi:MAG: metal-dependent transcriptional regulator [Anaerolineales bacterium]
MTRIHDFSESYEMYLKTVAELRNGDEAIPITAVAERLGVATVSASEMVHRLEDHGLLHHQPYKGVILTAEGATAADYVVRAHRIWEYFLVDKLGIDWADAHDLACNLEHATSLALSDALDTFLGHPERCPHGNPIPRTGQSAQGSSLRLSELEVGQQAEIRSIRPESSEVLKALAERGLKPGVQVTIEDIEVFDGPRRLTVADQTATIGRRLAEHIYVGQTL